MTATACTRGGADAVAPDEPSVAVLPGAIQSIAITVDVPATSTVTPSVASATSTTSAAQEATPAGAGRADSETVPASSFGPPNRLAPTVHASLLGVDGVRVEVGRVERAPLGLHTPGKARVFVVLRLRNVLAGTRLLTPTLPEPPAGRGLFLFGVQGVSVDSPGGVSVAGNTVRVELPSTGRVVASGEWDGLAFDYLRGTTSSCSTSATCAPWRRFDAPLEPGAVSEWRTVSYDVDATVRNLRLRFVVAADLANVS